MSSIKRIFVIVAVAIGIALMSASFISNDILNRSIIVGIGLDLSSDNQLVLTAEVVSPGNGSEEVGTFSKTVTATGQTISQAIQQVSQKTGKEASLGQCSLLILGESLYTQVDFSQVIDFFINSYNFKESSAICCAKGEARDFLNYSEALSQSVSLALVGMIQNQTATIGIPSNSLLEYARSQKELACNGFMNLIEFAPSQNDDEQNSNKIQGYFLYDKLVVFTKNKFDCILNENLTKGLALLTKEVDGEAFVVEKDKEKNTFIISEKRLDISAKQTDVKISLTLSGRLARTDDFGANGVLTAQTEGELNKYIINGVQNQASELVVAFLHFCKEQNLDLINLKEIYRRKQGNSQFVEQLQISNVNFSVNVEVKQK